MNEKLVCTRSYLAVIGAILQDSSLLDDIDRPLSREDFNTEPFYELLFVAITNLYLSGCKNIDELSIDSYLAPYPEQYKIFQDNNGIDYLQDCRDFADLGNYDYFYHKLRKYSLLRFYESKGYDIKNIYNYTITEEKAIQREQARFDELTEKDIVEYIEKELVVEPSMKYCSNTLTTDVQAAKGGKELIKELMEVPDVGMPLASLALNTICRGGRKGCLYMRSASQGAGKSRLAAADACKIAVPYYYDIDLDEWKYTGISEPTLYITTEVSVDAIQTILYATVSGVNEEHILYGTYEEGELERVNQAIEYIESSPLYICHIPDFSINDIKNVVKKYHREYSIDYFFFDYIFVSLRLMAEVSNRSKMAGLKEHQLLLVFATELKTLCEQLNIFMFTSSQLNGEAKDAPVKDERVLSGSKALANKLDIGLIAMPPNNAELKKIEPIMRNLINKPVPNMCFWIYKVRRGRLTRVIVWSYVDLGTMRIHDLFITNTSFQLIDVDLTKIETVDKAIEENSVRMSDVKDEPIEELEEEITVKRSFDW